MRWTWLAVAIAGRQAMGDVPGWAWAISVTWSMAGLALALGQPLWRLRTEIRSLNGTVSLLGRHPELHAAIRSRRNISLRSRKQKKRPKLPAKTLLLQRNKSA